MREELSVKNENKNNIRKITHAESEFRKREVSLFWGNEQKLPEGDFIPIRVLKTCLWENSLWRIRVLIPVWISNLTSDYSVFCPNLRFNSQWKIFQAYNFS